MNYIFNINKQNYKITNIILSNTGLLTFEYDCPNCHNTNKATIKHNTNNPMFLALLNFIEGKSQKRVRSMIQDAEEWEEGCFGWGSCPPEVFLAVTEFILDKLQ